jgi:mannose-1-phosphate guanylyltransferase
MRHAVILAGGSGTRLWPMSRAATPKQLIPFIGGRSLLSLAFERLDGLVGEGERWVCAGEAHRQPICAALPALAVDRYLGEPTGRDTLNALAYAAAVIAKVDPEATIGVFTADHLITPVGDFRRIVTLGYEAAESADRALITFGITPSEPSTAYGYLRLGPPFHGTARIVAEFREKPDRATAEEWVAQGPEKFLWNSGMFVWKAAAFLDCVRRYAPAAAQGASLIAAAWGTPRFPGVLQEVYPTLPKISVDFAIMEKASRDPAVTVAAVPMALAWKDVGSWPSFADTCPHDESGNTIAAEKCLLVDTKGTLVAGSDPAHLVAVLGCEDLIVVHTPTATLVCRRDRAEDVKKLQALAAERFGAGYV